MICLECNGNGKMSNDMFDDGPGNVCPVCAGEGRIYSDADKVLRERLAAIEHERWSDWQSYLHSKCTTLEDGSLVIPAGYVAALEAQIDTDYADLSEAQKDNDRQEVDRYWHLIEAKEDRDADAADC